MLPELLAGGADIVVGAVDGVEVDGAVDVAGAVVDAGAVVVALPVTVNTSVDGLLDGSSPVAANTIL